MFELSAFNGFPREKWKQNSNLSVSFLTLFNHFLSELKGIWDCASDDVCLWRNKTYNCHHAVWGTPIFFGRLCEINKSFYVCASKSPAVQKCASNLISRDKRNESNKLMAFLKSSCVESNKSRLRLLSLSLSKTPGNYVLLNSTKSLQVFPFPQVFWLIFFVNEEQKIVLNALQLLT
jgi:hypothetical protein